MNTDTAPGNTHHVATLFRHEQNVSRHTMSSREIAELTGSTHDNVLKTVRALVAKGVVSSNDTPYIHPQNGQVYREFLLSQRDTLVVVSGYSVELRARIIDRWQELEARADQFQIPATYAEALQRPPTKPRKTNLFDWLFWIRRRRSLPSSAWHRPAARSALAMPPNNFRFRRPGCSCGWRRTGGSSTVVVPNVGPPTSRASPPAIWSTRSRR